MDIQPCTPSPSKPPDLTHMDVQSSLPVRHEDRVCTPNLLEMPTEMIERISQFLPDSALLRFRLVSMQLNDKSFDVFRKRFFTHISARLRVRDLRRLIDIASHPLLGQNVKELQIRSTINTTADIFMEEMELGTRIRQGRVGDGGDEVDEEFSRKSRRWAQFLPHLLDQVKEEDHFRRSGLTCSYLAHAMRLLKNVEAITHVLEEPALQDWELNALWLNGRIPQTNRNYDLKPEPENQSLRQEDSEVIEDFGDCFPDWRRYLGGSTACSGDSDTIISAIIASRTPVTKLAICDGLFFKEEDEQGGDITLDSHSLQVRLLREGLRELKSLEISLRLHLDPNVNYPRWFLAAVPETLEELKIDRKFSWHIPDDPLAMSGDYEDFYTWHSVAAYDQILLRLTFPSLKRLDLSFPAGSAMHLVHFIRTNNKRLRHIRLICDEFGFRPNTARWSNVLSACLAAQHLNYLELWHGSDDYNIGGISQPEEGCILEDGLTSSPNNPGRERLETTMRSWRRLESAAGL